MEEAEEVDGSAAEAEVGAAAAAQEEEGAEEEEEEEEGVEVEVVAAAALIESFRSWREASKVRSGGAEAGGNECSPPVMSCRRWAMRECWASERDRPSSGSSCRASSSPPPCHHL